jgi:uncharacterized CHY-type Zn-finger protein
MRTHKKCPKCKQVLIADEFYKNRSNRDGLSRWCKKCSRQYDREDIVAALSLNNPFGLQITRQGWNQTRRLYHITIEEYLMIFNKQEGRCAGCNKRSNNLEEPFHVDHDHTTKKVRGLLCGCCNRTLGLINDDPQLLLLIRAYLLKHTMN